jgi:hypothetical protein
MGHPTSLPVLSALAPLDPAAASPASTSLHQTVGEVVIRGEAVTLIVVSDDRPEMALAHRLWFDVYVAELGYPPADESCRAERVMRLPSSGSLCLLACVGDRCVGTLRMSYCQRSPSEFELGFAHRLPDRNCGVLSKLVVAREYRRSPLSLHLLAACFDFNARSGHDRLYDAILMTCTPSMLHYYYLFGFAKLLDRPVHHPAFGVDTFVVACDRAANARAVRDIKRVLADHPWTKLRWAVRYQWCRLRARGDRRASGSAPRHPAPRPGKRSLGLTDRD